ncbi:MAG: IS1634 family transposase [Terriglobales bacterium]
MYVDRVPNRGSPPAVLLREAWREAGKIRKRTLANLSHWPDSKVESLRRLLRGETLVGPQDVFTIDSSLPHGHVEAVLSSIRKLGLENLIASKPSRERELVVAMLAERLLAPSSKLATTRLWNDSTLAEELSVGDADVDELYQALDWLLARQHRIEAKLAARHLKDGALVLYDATTSYYEGRSCALARFGHDRDGKKLPVILYGLLTDQAGRPLAVEVYPGNTGDPATVGDQVKKLRERFSLSRVVIVGDRGMLTQAQIEKLKQHPGLGWISSLRSHAIRSLVETGQLERSLFDETNLAEIHAKEFPGERLIACFNPLLAAERRRKREELLQATEKALLRLEAEVKRRTKTPLGKAEIGVKAGRVLGRFKMGKHFTLTIADGVFAWARREESIRREADLDGIYVVRTSEPDERLSAPDAVRTYKSLALVERAFRCLKGVDLLVRPIFHRTEDHVRAHIFLCMLAYYVEWHMREAWAPLLFQDEELSRQRPQRDPVAPAQPSPSARRKKSTRQSSEGLALHSFKTLLTELARRCRNTCRVKTDPHSSFTMVTDSTPLQARALQLLGL